MSFEALGKLEDQLEDLERRGNAVGDQGLRLRLVQFTKQVHEEIEKAFDGVFGILSEIVNVNPSQINDATVHDLLVKVDYAHSREKFKTVLEICDKLSELSTKYRPDIERALSNDGASYSELFHMLDKHEGLFRSTIESAVFEVAQELRKYQPGADIKEAQALADKARNELLLHLNRVRQTRISLSGKSGGVNALLDDNARADLTLRKSAWFSGSFYLAAVLVLLALLTFVAGSLSFAKLALVIVGAFVGMTLIGAMQLRNDDKLSERNFLVLTRLALLRVLLPVARKSGASE